MGREIKRVPENFDWPLDMQWWGFLMPESLHSKRCTACDGSGLNPETKKINDDWYDADGMDSGRWRYDFGVAPDGRPATHPPWRIRGKTTRWCYALTQHEVDALLEAKRLQRDFKEKPSAEQVNLWAQSASLLGHDGVNMSICVRARAGRLGVYGQCDRCHGDGEAWHSKAQEEAAESWMQIQPPTGPAYQVWETVSEGSPVSPPFLRPEDLADWMVANDSSVTRGTTREQWVKFIAGPGWAPSMVAGPGGLQSGVAFVADSSGSAK